MLFNFLIRIRRKAGGLETAPTFHAVRCLRSESILTRRLLCSPLSRAFITGGSSSIMRAATVRLEVAVWLTRMS